MYDAKAFSRDDKTLYFTSDQGGEFTSLMAMDLKKKSERPVLAPSWDVEDAGFSPHWKYFWSVTNADGSHDLKLEESATHKDVALSLPAKTGWVPAAFSKSDRFVGLSLHGDTAPTTLYVVDLKDGKASKLAETLPDSLRNREMVEGKSVRIPSFDGKPVPAYLYRPAGTGPFPAVIDVHGGPTSQSQREFSAIRQYLVSKGYVVLVPNVRGSTGYGKSYTKLDNLDLGGGPLQDVVACKKWLVKEAGADEAKVVVLGGSYGGYMALAAAAFTPGEFAASVDYFGVSDLKSLVESFPAYWQTSATFIYRKFGDPKNPADAKYQHDRSPLYSLDEVKSPLLIVQGERDARVKKDQSDRVVEALTKQKVPVHYLVLANEGHGFSKNENRLAAYRATDRFLDRYIWGDTSVEVMAEPAPPAK
jgi:dipeptidyl aminopeptidase/acylaminoacyl peptidase